MDGEEGAAMSRPFFRENQGKGQREAPLEGAG